MTKQEKKEIKARMREIMKKIRAMARISQFMSESQLAPYERMAAEYAELGGKLAAAAIDLSETQKTVLQHLGRGGDSSACFGNGSVHLMNAARALVRKGLAVQGSRNTDIYISEAGREWLADNATEAGDKSSDADSGAVKVYVADEEVADGRDA